MKRSWKATFGPWAVVAGASRGLGLAFAQRIAERGVHVVMVAEAEADLKRARQVMPAGVEVDTLVVDLRDADAATRILSATADRDVGLLVYNATHTNLGSFVSGEISNHLDVVRVNCATTVALVHGFAGRMVQRGNGGIVLMASLTAFMGTPYVATYGASKAFALCLAEGIGAELAGQGVDVLVGAPGAVATPNYLDSIPDGVKSPAPLLSPRWVARDILDQLGRRRVHVPGWKNRVIALLLGRLLPRSIAVRIMGSVTRRLYG